jgi:hypothetical protein
MHATKHRNTIASKHGGGMMMTYLEEFYLKNFIFVIVLIIDSEQFTILWKHSCIYVKL